MTGAAPWAIAAAMAIQGSLPMPFALGDARIQQVVYSPDQVVTLRVESGYAAVVELSPDERIDTVVVGDSAAWQVSANRRGDRLVVKPLGPGTATDMVVVTDVRRYVFLLEPGAQGQAPFVLRFAYPASAAEIASAPVVAATYRLKGEKRLLPAAMHDDGRRTTVTWMRDSPLPAIFAVGRDGREAIVNGRMVGGDYVVEGVAPRYVFRLDKARATATRRPVERAR